MFFRRVRKIDPGDLWKFAFWRWRRENFRRRFYAGLVNPKKPLGVDLPEAAAELTCCVGEATERGHRTMSQIALSW
jgi:hypothetical protein